MNKRGFDLFSDIKTSMPRFSPRVVFDVGANIGQSAIEFYQHYPACDIYCFEPIQSTYMKLEKDVANIPNCRCFNIALGAQPGRASMRSDIRHSTRSRVLIENETVQEGSEYEVVEVTVDTIDHFCEKNGIPFIDFLKIDVEGRDFEVLSGADGMLKEGNVEVIMIEAGMNPDNDLHVPFNKIYEFLQDCGYYLFAFYEQKEEWIKKQPHLRRTNPVFIKKPQN